MVKALSVAALIKLLNSGILKLCKRKSWGLQYVYLDVYDMFKSNN